LDIDVSRYLNRLWRGRIWILAVGALCGAAVFALSVSGGRTYRSSLVLQVTSSKVTDGSTPASTATMRPIIESRVLVGKVIRSLGLDKPPASLSTSDFLAYAFSIEEIRGTNLLKLRVRLPNPELAAKALNTLADAAVATARRLSQAEAVLARDQLGVHLQEAQQRLNETEAHLRETMATSQLDLARADVEELLRQRMELRWIELDIQSARAKASAAETELARRQPRSTIKRSLFNAPALAGLAANPGSAEAAAGVQVSEDYVSPVYEEIDGVLANSRTNLAGLEKQRARLVDDLGLNRTALPQIGAMAAAEVAQSRAETEHLVARKVFEDVATRYESARVKVNERSSQLQIIDPAVPAEAPEPRGALRKSAMAFVAGAALTAVLLLLIAAVRDVAASQRA
jgi:uncharacterized protein involved in exopolysaccharide biosynthesis